MSAHTLGPYRIRRHGPEYYVVASGPAGDVEIATVHGEAEYTPRLPAEANARLIAAAPDLLAVCKTSLQWIEAEARAASWHNNNTPGVGQTVPHQVEPWHLVKLLSLAIAKAEGGAP